MSTNRNNATIAATCNQRINALKANVPANTQIGIGGETYKPAQLIAIYQEILDNQAALIKSRAQVETDLAARRDAEARRDAIEFPLKNWVLNHLSGNAPSEFGYAAPKKAKKTAEEKATAVKLALATREARGTKGKKQRLKIKGSIATPSEPAAPAVHAAPAAVAPVVAPVATTTTGGVTPAALATN